MQTWRLDNGTLTLHKVQCNNGTVTMEDCTRCMQIFMKTALAQAGATQKCCEFLGKNCRNPAGEQPEPTQNAVNSHKNVAGTHKSPHRSPPQMLYPQEPTPEPTSNAVNSHRNTAGTHKSPGGTHTGAHLKCCKFSGKRSRNPKFTHKSPTGAHTGAHLKCCKFSGKRGRSPKFTHWEIYYF